MKRRSFLLGSSGLLTLGLMDAACTNGSLSPTTEANLKQASADIQTFSDVLAAFSPALSAIPGAGPVLALAVQYAPVFAKLAASLTSTNSGSVVTTITADVSQIIQAAQSPSVSVALPANVKQAISDIQIVLPAIEALIAGLSGASPTSDAARFRLQAFAAGKH